jgi:hypothetical protein
MQMKRARGQAIWLVWGMLLATSIVLAAGPAFAGANERAKRIHDRLTGVPPTDTVLAQMVARLNSPSVDAVGAAEIAMLDYAFANSLLKTFVTPWTNEEMTVFAPLNDYTATVIGIIWNRRDFREVLTADDIYIGSGQLPGYSINDNLHYEALEDAGVDLRSVLVSRDQSSLSNSQTWIRDEEAAGVITTRSSAKAFFRAGTNRRMWRYLAINYLCSDMESLQDNTRPVDRIRQDVSRSPGSESQIFLDTCSGCHSGMDPLSGAFAYYEWVPDPNDATRGRMEYTRGVVQPKHLINANTFAYGHATVDDRWDNYWHTGTNSVYGWRTSGSGYGAKSLGAEVANSEGFSRCQVNKVFKQVCYREPTGKDDLDEVEVIRTNFETNGYDLMDVFAEVAAYCTAGL